MKELRIKEWNMILIEKMQKYQNHDLVKPTNMNSLQVVLPPHQYRIEKARFPYSSLGKPFEK